MLNRVRGLNETRAPWSSLCFIGEEASAAISKSETARQKYSDSLRRSEPFSSKAISYLLNSTEYQEEVMETQTQSQSYPGNNQAEDRFTKTVEEYTGAIPSSAYLGIAVAAMAASLVFQTVGRGKWGNFIAQWVPTWLIIGLYNKMVKLQGHDPYDRG